MYRLILICMLYLFVFYGCSTEEKQTAHDKFVKTQIAILEKIPNCKGMPIDSFKIYSSDFVYKLDNSLYVVAVYNLDIFNKFVNYQYLLFVNDQGKIDTVVLSGAHIQWK